jgi:tetratricopeptide (TPR) repeat protein
LGKDDPIVYSDIWYNIGYTYVLIGEWELALEAYKISLEYFPENIESMNNIGVIESKTSVEVAINWGEKSFREFPNFEAAFNLSIWFFETSNFEKAYFYNQETLKLYPQHA